MGYLHDELETPISTGIAEGGPTNLDMFSDMTWQKSSRKSEDGQAIKRYLLSGEGLDSRPVMVLGGKSGVTNKHHEMISKTKGKLTQKVEMICSQSKEVILELPNLGHFVFFFPELPSDQRDDPRGDRGLDARRWNAVGYPVRAPFGPLSGPVGQGDSPKIWGRAANKSIYDDYTDVIRCVG